MTMAERDWFAAPPPEKPAESPDDSEIPDFSEKTAAEPPDPGENFEISLVKELEAQEQVIPGVTTGALLDAMANPDVFQEVARGDLYIQLARMRRHAINFSPGQQLEYSKLLAKLGKVAEPEKFADNPMSGVPMIKIEMGNGHSVSIGAANPAPAEKDITAEAIEHGD